MVIAVDQIVPITTIVTMEMALEIMYEPMEILHRFIGTMIHFIKMVHALIIKSIKAR